MEVFLIAGNDGQLIESWRRLGRSEAVERAKSLFERLLMEDLKQIGVINRTTKNLTKWELPNKFEENFPMALDELDHRLFIVTRTPPRLVVYDTNSGQVVATQPCVAEVCGVAE